MQIRLPARQQRFIRQLIVEGQYATADEVIADALAVFAREELRRAVAISDKDVREGRVSDWDAEEAKRDLLNRLKRSKKKASCLSAASAPAGRRELTSSLSRNGSPRPAEAPMQP